MKKLIRFALKKPISVMVVVLAIGFFSFTAIKKINVDIFPEVELPAIYVAMPYGGLSPAYMDGFMADNFQKVLQFVGGVKNIDFKSVQGLTLIKLTFYPGTEMSQAAAEVSTSVSRAMGFLPTGAVPPIVVRFDGGSLPVGKLVFESENRSISEIQTLVVTRIRSMFVSIPGITAPAPFGGSARSILVNLKPEMLQTNGLSPEEVTKAIAQNSMPAPAGNIRIGDKNLMTPVNSIAKTPQEFLNTPIKKLGNRMIYVKDVASVKDGADQITGYALVNGKRSVYLPVIKKAGASTLSAVKNLKKSLPMLKNQLPDDVSMRYEFDQSKHISHSLENLIHEGLLGALFTGLMIFLFLGDTRGALIVVLTIPVAILVAVTVLYLSGQTINIMTLSGLALSIGILVDEGTVTIENIHQHLDMGKKKKRAVLDAVMEISVPKLLILLCILAVLTPAFIMKGIPKDMFLPLSLAVAFAMIASFIASQTFVPILASWFLKRDKKKKKRSPFEKFKMSYAYRMRKWSSRAVFLFCLYLMIAGGIIVILFTQVGTDIMPTSNSGDFQMRIEAPIGSRIEKTEDVVKDIITNIKDQLPDDAVTITSSYVGMEPANTPINQIFTFTSSSSEAVLQVAVDQDIYTGNIEGLKEKIRKVVHERHPKVQFNYEPMNLTDKILSQGAMTPIEVKVGALQVQDAYAFANKIKDQLKDVPYLRDLRIAEPVYYPALDVKVNRDLVGQFGLTMKDVTNTLVTATSSTRYTNKNLWVDPKSGRVFQVQVQIPKGEVNATDKLRSLPIKKGSMTPILEDVAHIHHTTMPAQINRKGPSRYVTLIANVYKKDLGTASKTVTQAINKAGAPPKGVVVWTEGMLNLLTKTLGSLQIGLLLAIVAIFLMLAAYYQSFKTPLVILSVLPAVIAGSFVALYLTGSTLNLQSYMGMIMAIGISVSNTVLLIDQAEFNRKRLFLSPYNAARLAAASRLRPVLMTAAAMLAGMIPMAIGIGQGSEQAAPLGRAVIGGLIASTFAVLLLIPHFFASMTKRSKVVSPSLDPDDKESSYHSK